MCAKELHLFWKEHKDDTECMYCDRSRYVKVINEDGSTYFEMFDKTYWK
jgi:hypothetical protein